MLSALGLAGSPPVPPDEGAPLVIDVPLPVMWFAAGWTTVELRCDDRPALGLTAHTYADCRVLPVARPRWTLTLHHITSLAAAPAAFVAVPLLQVAAGVAAHYQHDEHGHTWWIPRPAMIVHNSARTPGRIGIRYVRPIAARAWAPRLVGRLLAAGSP